MSSKTQSACNGDQLGWESHQDPKTCDQAEDVNFVNADVVIRKFTHNKAQVMLLMLLTPHDSGAYLTVLTPFKDLP
jgi:hypothetical protein